MFYRHHKGMVRWTMENDEWIPVMKTLLRALEAIIQLVKCKCAQERFSKNRCQCRKVGLLCTDSCRRTDNDHECENQQGKCDDYDGDIEDEDDDDDDDDDSLN